MKRSIILAVGILLLGALVAEAYTIPTIVTAGNITVGCTRTPSGGVNAAGNTIPAGYDEVDFYLTGMLGSAAGKNTDGTQCRINIIEGRWTASTGAFWVATQSGQIPAKGKTSNVNWMTPTYSTINFDSTVSGATIWTNTAGGGGIGTQTSGNLYNFFSGSWYTTDYGADLVAPINANYTGSGTNSTYLAAMFVTSATPNANIAYDGKLAFTYGGGTVENVNFHTTPEPGTLALLAAGLMGLVAYAWRKRRQ